MAEWVADPLNDSGKARFHIDVSTTAVFPAPFIDGAVEAALAAAVCVLAAERVFAEVAGSVVDASVPFAAFARRLLSSESSADALSLAVAAVSAVPGLAFAGASPGLADISDPPSGCRY